MLVTAEPTVVATRQGKVRGTVVDGVHVFRGVPFAAPPFAENRLGAPRPPALWHGIRDATEDGPIPPQPSVAGDAEGFLPPPGVQGEDCLNLTVWTPDPTASRLPVIVWITGGSFQFGSANWYDGSRFARDGVVLVAINYRAGAEGFLWLPDAAANRGLLDQLAAVAWVRDNIAAFGGDPDLITVCGESAGAMSIGILLATPRARGLFRRAILQSGAAHHALELSTARRIGETLAAKLRVSYTRAAVATLPAERLLEAQLQVAEDVIADPDPERWGADVVASMMAFQPVIDGDVLPGRAIDRIEAGSAAEIDLLVGTNANDWQLFLAASGQLATLTEETVGGPASRYGHLSAGAYGLPAERALAAYRLADPSATPGGLLSAIQTAWWCRVPAIRLADAHAGDPSRTFMYEFAWRSPVAGGMFGACHALEIPFIFDTLDQGSRQMVGALLGDDPPQSLAERMHRAWISFAASGDAGWPDYEIGRRATMRFDTTSTVVDDPYTAERVLWEGIR